MSVPWPVLGLGLLGALVAIGAWWAGTTLTGPLRVLCDVASVAAALFAAYNLVLSAGWVLLSWGLGRWMGALRRRSARREGSHLLELRFRGDDDPDARWPPGLDDAFLADDALGPDVSCGEISSGPGSMTCHVTGKDLDRMVDAVRRAAGGLVLPPDAYLWVPDLDRSGYGWVLPLRAG